MLTLEPLPRAGLGFAPAIHKDSRGRIRTTINGYRFELLRRKDGSISFNVFRRGEDWEVSTQNVFGFSNNTPISGFSGNTPISTEAMRIMTRNPEFTRWLQAAMAIV